MILDSGKVTKMLYGGDYNPEQWLDRPDILEEDIRMMIKYDAKKK